MLPAYAQKQKLRHNRWYRDPPPRIIIASDFKNDYSKHLGRLNVAYEIFRSICQMDFDVGNSLMIAYCFDPLFYK